MSNLKHAIANMVDLEVFDGQQADSETLLFDLDGHLTSANGLITENHFADRLFHTSKNITVGGRPGQSR